MLRLEHHALLENATYSPAVREVYLAVLFFAGQPPSLLDTEVRFHIFTSERVQPPLDFTMGAGAGKRVCAHACPMLVVQLHDDRLPARLLGFDASALSRVTVVAPTNWRLR